MYNKLIAWEREDNYMGEDYSPYYIAYSKSRDSDILTESNYETVRAFLDSEKIKYEEVRFNHWACGWIEALMVEKCSDPIELELLNDFLDQEYPVLNESDYCERLHEYAMDYFNDNIKDDEELAELVKARLEDNHAIYGLNAEDVSVALLAAYEEACSYYGEEEAFIDDSNIDKMLDNIRGELAERLEIETITHQLRLL